MMIVVPKIICQFGDETEPRPPKMRRYLNKKGTSLEGAHFRLYAWHVSFAVCSLKHVPGIKYFLYNMD